MAAKPHRARRNVLRKAADADIHPAEPRTPASAKPRTAATGTAAVRRRASGARTSGE